MGLWALLPWCAVLAVLLTPNTDLKRLALAVAVTTAVAAPLTHTFSYLPESLEAIELLLLVGLLLGLAQVTQRFLAVGPERLLANGWLLAVSLTSLRSSLDLIAALKVGLVSAAGFYLFTHALQALYLRVDQARVAPALQGIPMLLICAAMMGLALFGLASFGVL